MLPRRRALALGALLTAGCAELNPDFSEPAGDDSSEGALAPTSDETSGQTLPADVGEQACVAPSLVCGEGCVDPRWNALHCGGCDQPCGGMQVCAEGECAADCPAERPDACGISCVDLQSDAMNCGLCERACTGDETCLDGVCTPACEKADQTSCDGKCVNVDKDPKNCGACGVVCAQKCTMGQCEENCDGQC